MCFPEHFVAHSVNYIPPLPTVMSQNKTSRGQTCLCSYDINAASAQNTESRDEAWALLLLQPSSCQLPALPPDISSDIYGKCVVDNDMP